MKRSDIVSSIPDQAVAALSKTALFGIEFRSPDSVEHQVCHTFSLALDIR